MTIGQTAGKIGISYYAYKSSDTEIDTLKNNDEEEGDVGKKS